MGVLRDQLTARRQLREQQVIELLLQGCEDSEIASQLHVAKRTIKMNMNVLFRRFKISGGIKRVKLAVILYRIQVRQNATPPV